MDTVMTEDIWNGVSFDETAEASEMQRALIQTTLDSHRLSVVIGSGETHLDKLTWYASDSNAASNQLYTDLYKPLPQNPRRRVLLDSFLSEEQVHYFAIESLDRFGDPMFYDPDFSESETAVAFGDWGDHPLNEKLFQLVRQQMCTHFDEHRDLFLAGSMITRKTPEHRGVSQMHVDKANIGYYDYSAVIYLSTYGLDFDGGQFIFFDTDCDEVIEPRAGRCLLFSSGMEHLHQVSPVTKGARLAIGMWLTLTESCAIPLCPNND